MRTYNLLDGLRGVAAIAVVMRHMPDLFPPNWMPGSHMAVDLFFVLSGFVIAHAYEERLGNGMTKGRFMILRVIRLYPMFLLAAVVGAPLAIAQGVLMNEPTWYLWAAIPLSLFMIPSPLGPMPFPSVGAAWSLMFEMIANALYALTWRWLSLPVLCVTVAVFGLWFADTSLALQTTDGGFTWATFTLGLCRVMFSFPLGVLLYRLHRRGFRVPTPPAAVLLIALLASFVPPHVEWQVIATLFLLPAIVLAAAQIEIGGWTSRLALFFGVISYPIYLLHPLLTGAIKYVVRNYATDLGWDMRIAVGVIIVTGLIVASWMIERVYEKPLRKWMVARLTTSSMKPNGIKKPRWAAP